MKTFEMLIKFRCSDDMTMDNVKDYIDYSLIDDKDMSYEVISVEEKTS